MKVILLKDIKGTGTKDQIIEVNDGYGRNFLIPRKMAIEATAEALNAIERSKAAAKHREDVKKAEAEKLARFLKDKTVTVKVRAGENGRLYGCGQNDHSGILKYYEHITGTEVRKQK